MEDASLVAARAKLETALLRFEQVSLIDVGQDQGPRAPHFRVHLFRGTDPKTLPIPDQVDGVPVRVLFGDYRLD